ncbi:hypothetical protein [Salinibacter sp.]|nr:hypothetical protein [Salinibacter sp.]
MVGSRVSTAQNWWTQLKDLISGIADAMDITPEIKQLPEQPGDVTRT